jgi:hypothetical protein
MGAFLLIPKLFNNFDAPIAWGIVAACVVCTFIYKVVTYGR